MPTITAAPPATEATIAWLRTTTEQGFLGSLRFQLGRYGQLTDNQVRVAEKIRLERMNTTQPLVIPPAGRYVVIVDGVRHLLQIDCPGEGDKYPGWTFIQHEVAYNERTKKSAMDRLATKPRGQELRYHDRRAQVWLPTALRKISENLVESLVAYGNSRGRCGICGRTLSDPESVARGIGPVCLAKL